MPNGILRIIKMALGRIYNTEENLYVLSHENYRIQNLMYAVVIINWTVLFFFFFACLSSRFARNCTLIHLVSMGVCVCVCTHTHKQAIAGTVS